jgi:hypothetical protein
MTAQSATATAATIQAGIFITVLASPSTIDPHGQLSDCMSKKQINELMERAESNEWEWCDVEVLAEYTDENGTEYSASEYLGACSYKSRQDFIKNSGYYDDMLQTVTEDIMKQLAAA